MTFKRFAKNAFITLVFLTLLTPLILFKELLFPYISGKAFFFRILIELVLPFYFYLIFTNPTLRPKLKSPLTISLVIFFLINAISALLGQDVVRSFWGMFERMDSVFMLAHLLMFYFYLLLLAGLSGSLFEKFLKALVWVSAVASLNGIVGFLGGPTFTPDISLPARASSTFGNPIFFASFLILPLALALFFAMREESKGGKIFYWSMFFLQGLALIFSGTRGAMVGLVGGVFISGIFYIFFTTSQKIKKLGILALALAGVFGILIFIFGQKLKSGSSFTRLLSFKDSNTQSRLIQWKTALKGFKDNPILGVGPNNYYVISNKYYDLKMWQYDRGWFDKPHNYQLELLATTGILGLAAYLGIFILALWAIYLAYKKDLLTLFESCVLAAGFIAYQIQNLFVFDTVSASIAFFVFLSFLKYLMGSSGEVPVKGAKTNLPLSSFAPAIVWVGVPVIVYMVYATNWTGWQISKNLNLSKIFQQENFDAAKAFLDKAANSNLNFYLRDTAYEYSNFAAWYSNKNQSPEQLAKSRAMMVEAVKINRRAAERHSGDPTVWLKLANTLFAQSHLEAAGFNQEAFDMALKAKALAPKKHDPKLFMAQVAIEGKKPEIAIPLLLEVLADFPDLHDARWQLADLYYFSQKQQEAENLAMEAVKQGFVLDKIKKGDWLLTYYYDLQQPDKALEFLLTQVKGNELSADYFARLADAYNKSGRFSEARAAALKLLEIDPTAKADVEAFLNSLPAQ